MMTPFLVAIAVLTVAGIGIRLATVLREPRRDRRRRRGLEEISTARDGAPTRVRGTVVCTDPLRAPYTERQCVYYSIELFSDTWDLSVSCRAVERRDFRIEHEGFAAEVLVERARYEVVDDIVEIGRASQLSARGKALVARFGWTVPPIANIQLREAVVAVGAPIEIAGAGIREPDEVAARTDRGYRDPQPMLLVFSGEVSVLGDRRDRYWIGNAPQP